MAGRIPFWRILAIGFGVLVLLAHTVTLREMVIQPHWLYIDWEDLGYHSATMATFALIYRLSFTRDEPGGVVSTILFCSGWGAMCEILQHWIPDRDFSVFEFSVNTLTPVIMVGLLRLIRLR